MFVIDTERVSVLCDSLNKTEIHLSNLISELNDSISAVSSLKGMEEVLADLRVSRAELEDEQYTVKDCRSILEKVDEGYRRSEDQVIRKADGSSG